jgi:DHA2 family multidrug resistance protein
VNTASAPPLRGAALGAASVSIASASFMNVLDTTIVVVALPTIAGDLAATPSQASWIMTIYGVCLAVMLPLSGWITAQFGQVRTFVVSVLLFTATSWLCAAAQTFDQLLLFRALQGLAGGLQLPLSQSLLMRIYPPEKHGVALGVWSLSSGVAPVAGPLLGGLITDSVGWPWVFYINIPVGLLAAWTCWSLVRPYESERKRMPVDAVGLILLVVGVIAGQLALDRGHELDWLASIEIRVLVAVSLISLVLFFAWERDEPHPVVDFSIFSHGNFVLGCTLISVFYVAMVVSGVIYPLWMQTVLGYNARSAGLVMATTSLIPLIALPIAGQAFRTMDPRPLVTVGGLLGFWAILMHAQATTSASFEYLAWTRFAVGLAMPLCWMPLMMTTMVGLPPEKIGTAAGLFNFWRMLAASIATAGGVTYWEERTVVHRERLVEDVSRPSADRDAFLHWLQGSAGDTQQALAALEVSIGREARTLAQSDLYLIFAAGMLLLAVGCWRLRVAQRVAPAAAASIAHD